MARSRLLDIVIDCARPSTQAAFWAEVLGYRVQPPDDSGDTSIKIIATDGCPNVWFDLVPEPKIVKNRVHLDVKLRPGETLDWLVRLGATIVRPKGTTPGQRWTVMADPEGNEFCAFLPDA